MKSALSEQVDDFLDKNKTLTRDEPDGEDQPAEEYENSNFGVIFSGC